MGQVQYQQQPNQHGRSSPPRRRRGKAAVQESELPPRRKLERIFPDPKQGLSNAQASELLANGYGNEEVASNAKTTKQIVRENTLTFFNLVFVV